MLDALATERVVIVDGGMGSELEARGARMDHEAWCGLANLEDPGLVREIHEDYIRAGADVVIANTFPTNRTALAAAGYGDRVEEANRAAVTAALEARERAGRPVAVAGSMSLWGPHDRLPAEEPPPEAHVPRSTASRRRSSRTPASTRSSSCIRRSRQCARRSEAIARSALGAGAA